MVSKTYYVFVDIEGVEDKRFKKIVYKLLTSNKVLKHYKGDDSFVKDAPCHIFTLLSLLRDMEQSPLQPSAVYKWNIATTNTSQDYFPVQLPRNLKQVKNLQ